MKRTILLALVCLLSLPLVAEDGSKLWLRYSEEGNATVSTKVKHPSVEIARKELTAVWSGLPVELKIDRKLSRLGEGYRIVGSKEKVTVSASQPVGLLYGAYHLLRLQETGGVCSEHDCCAEFEIEEKPAWNLRILNHWDNLDGSIERGYAGLSLWKWDELPETLSPRYEQYARANASVGINATVLNNVNANAQILTADYLKKVKALADIFRPYGIRVFLSANFAAPRLLGGTADSDPLNPAVAAWWKAKASEIYGLIPDFGGFLVKANSEGQSGPQDYGRTHADGANMLAAAVAPHGGVVMWRAFVYASDSPDRAGQAYDEFMPLDGKFADNVIIQIKNGPVDFQPREPFSPLFGAMKHTAEMVEFQITQEYLGHSNHLVYLAPLFKEVLDSDTYCEGEGSTVAKVTDGTIRPAARVGKTRVSAVAGVANTGDNVNWTGHDFAQSNWYAFGRLAWNPALSSEQIADEWLRMTFNSDEAFVAPVKDMMLTSREACVNYMMPLGLHHIFAFNQHYGPEPWGFVPGMRQDWLPVYYHKADAAGVGFDRTTATGSGTVAQYFPPLNELYGNLSSCPEEYLLWFHHVAWDYRLKSGRTLWDELCYKYDLGLQAVREYQKTWDRIEDLVDAERFAAVQAKLKLQTVNAQLWKDACLLYFQTFAREPIPYELERPVHDLKTLMSPPAPFRRAPRAPQAN
ncbi:MAG: alpha-glucuronidase [Rikenellaceae bacterium]|jgi:alpha-glucuronidase|nr:alpha-glucuronidase [Rikenellaceae bacterium]